MSSATPIYTSREPTESSEVWPASWKIKMRSYLRWDWSHWEYWTNFRCQRLSLTHSFGWTSKFRIEKFGLSRDIDLWYGAKVAYFDILNRLGVNHEYDRRTHDRHSRSIAALNYVARQKYCISILVINISWLPCLQQTDMPPADRIQVTLSQNQVAPVASSNWTEELSAVKRSIISFTANMTSINYTLWSHTFCWW